MLYASSLDKMERVPVMPVESNVLFTAGYLIYTRDRMLVAQRFDPHTLRRTGEAFSLGGPLTAAALMNTVIENVDFSAAGNILAFHLSGSAPDSRSIHIIRNWAQSSRTIL
jgi:hypothetical protein